MSKDEVDFGVHKSLLCHYSPYFKAAFTSGFEETHSGIMRLPETRTKVFQLFNDWLYTQDSESILDTSQPEDQWTHSDHIVQLCVFADMALIPGLKNQCIDAIRKKSLAKNLFPYHLSRYVWENTTEKSLLRKFYIDEFVWGASASVFSSPEKHLTWEICGEVMTEMRRINRLSIKPSNPKKNMENYHEPIDA